MVGCCIIVIVIVVVLVLVLVIVIDIHRHRNCPRPRPCPHPCHHLVGCCVVLCCVVSSPSSSSSSLSSSLSSSSSSSLFSSSSSTSTLSSTEIALFVPYCCGHPLSKFMLIARSRLMHNHSRQIHVDHPITVERTITPKLEDIPLTGGGVSGACVRKQRRHPHCAKNRAQRWYRRQPTPKKASWRQLDPLGKMVRCGGGPVGLILRSGGGGGRFTAKGIKMVGGT